MEYIDEVNNNPDSTIAMLEVEYELHQEVLDCYKPSASWMFKLQEVWL